MNDPRLTKAAQDLVNAADAAERENNAAAKRDEKQREEKAIIDAGHNPNKMDIRLRGSGLPGGRLAQIPGEDKATRKWRLADERRKAHAEAKTQADEMIARIKLRKEGKLPPIASDAGRRTQVKRWHVSQDREIVRRGNHRS